MKKLALWILAFCLLGQILTADAIVNTSGDSHVTTPLQEEKELSKFEKSVFEIAGMNIPFWVVIYAVELICLIWLWNKKNNWRIVLSFWITGAVVLNFQMATELGWF